MASRARFAMVGISLVGWMTICGDGGRVAVAESIAAPETSSNEVSRHSALQLNNQGVREAQAGRFEEAAALLRQALALTPDDPTTHQNLSRVMTDWARQLEQAGKDQEAMAILRTAVEHDPANGLASIRLGDLAYLMGDVPVAVAHWKRAYGHVPAIQWHGVSSRIAQAERDQRIEHGFLLQQTPHFDLHLQSGSAGRRLTSLTEGLEHAYGRLLAALGDAPARITVILYSEGEFQRVSGTRDWAVGFYDGRIRLRWNEVGAPQERALIAHELAHAFLHHAYGHHLPLWVHEGYAQLQEGTPPRAPEQLRLEERVRARTQWVPLKWLDARFTQPSGREDIQGAYVQARVVVEELVKRHGMDRFTLFLQHLAAGRPVEAAYDEAFAPARWVRADQGVFD